MYLRLRSVFFQEGKQMRKNYIFGALIAIAGLLIAIGPKTFFAVCASDGEMVMKCLYVAQTELVIGIAIALLGIVLFFSKNSAAQITTSIALALNGIITILIPNVLIGVCKSEHMHCNAVTRPALNILGGLVIVLSVIGIILFREKDSKVNE